MKIKHGRTRWTKKIGWSVVLFYGVSTHPGSLNAELDFNNSV